MNELLNNKVVQWFLGLLQVCTASVAIYLFTNFINLNTRVALLESREGYIEEIKEKIKILDDKFDKQSMILIELKAEIKTEIKNLKEY